MRLILQLNTCVCAVCVRACRVCVCVCVFACFKGMKTLHLYPFRYSCHHDCSCDLALLVCLGSPYTAVLFFACDWQEAVGFQSSLSPRVRPTNERRQCRNQASGRNMIQTQYAVIMLSIDSKFCLKTGRNFLAANVPEATRATTAT